MSLKLALIASVALAMAPHAAIADTTAALVARTQAQWTELEYDKVIELADQVVAATDATPQQRVEVLRLKAYALVVLERLDDANRVLDQLYTIDPDYELPPGSSPRFQLVFKPARARWQAAEEQRLATELGDSLRALQMHVHLPSHPRGGLPLEIDVELADPSSITDRIVLSRRHRGAGYFTTSEQRAHAGTIAFTISGEDTASPTPYTLEFHVQAKHRSGVAVRREGTAEQPLALDVAAGEVPRPSPITHRWWFWAGIAAIAIGGGFLVDQTISVGPQRVVAKP